MDKILILNKLPLPNGYNGHQWNSQMKSRRKSIPKYLLADLPKMQHICIKKMFQQAQKISCPPISYFDNRIKLKREKKQRINKQKRDLKNLKQQFQYALILSDRQSNVFDELLQKSARQQNKSYGATDNKRQMSERKTRREQRQKYFDNTMDLVIKHRQKQIKANQTLLENQ